MKTEKTKAHFTDNYLLNPTNPIEVNLIGAGGTGSQMLTALARMNHALTALGHAGLQLTLWDDDTVAEANLSRQLFAECELGLYKSVALINRINRFFGTYWKAQIKRFEKNGIGKLPEQCKASITISCVDNVSARFGIADILKELQHERTFRNKPSYWIDFGNSRYSGQVVLSTIGKINQPTSKKYETVDVLPFVTDEYAELLRASESTDDSPSCSLAEALEKQDLFINSTLAQLGGAMLWQLFREGMVQHRGFFLNLKTFRTQPLFLD